MGKLYPPIREKDITSKVWVQFFENLRNDPEFVGALTFVGALISGLTASRLLATDGSKSLASVANLASWIASTIGLTVTNDGDGTITINVKQQLHEADASTAHAITDPGDAPADADELRDDLVANTIPSIEAALNALGTKVNNILAKMETAEILAAS